MLCAAAANRTPLADLSLDAAFALPPDLSQEY